MHIFFLEHLFLMTGRKEAWFHSQKERNILLELNNIAADQTADNLKKIFFWWTVSFIVLTPLRSDMIKTNQTVFFLIST